MSLFSAAAVAVVVAVVVVVVVVVAGGGDDDGTSCSFGCEVCLRPLPDLFLLLCFFPCFFFAMVANINILVYPVR